MARKTLIAHHEAGHAVIARVLGARVDHVALFPTLLADPQRQEHLTEREVERLIEVVKDNRWGHRDATMVLVAFRHGLRASELIDLRWDQVNLEQASCTSVDSRMAALPRTHSASVKPVNPRRSQVVCNAVIESSKPRCKFATCSDTRSNPSYSSWNTQKLLE
jgi:integrase